MLDVLHQLAGGFLHVMAPVNFVALVVGLVVGMLVAVLPGLTLVMGVVLALPFTYGMSITPSIILLTASPFRSVERTRADERENRPVVLEDNGTAVRFVAGPHEIVTLVLAP